MKAIELERHFPWYIDSADTDNIDCQCGQPCDGIAGWATHVQTTLTTQGVTMKDPVTIQAAAAINLALYAGQQFTKAWARGDLASDIGPKLRCEEVEALADMLDCLGQSLAARTWIREHSISDDCGDMHCACHICTTEAK